jgi:transposase
MLSAHEQTPFTDFDRQVYDTLVPADHYLRRVGAVIDFERFRPLTADAYSPTMGRPAIDPVQMLKILFLSFHYRLSDRQVMQRAQTDAALRWFLGLRLHDALPHHTCGTYFRQRLGEGRFQQIFQEVVSQAREHGLVHDRLRLKDATHVFADAADMKPLGLAAQVREHLLRAAQPFWPDWQQTQRLRIDNLRQATAEATDAERLAARIELVRDLAQQLRDKTASWPAAEDTPAQQRLRRMLDVVDHLLADHADPQAGDRLVNAADADARIGKHGSFFVGYLLDLAIDADSEIITAVNVLPANGAEAADAAALIAQEEQAQGNDVEAMSLDGAGYNGPVLRELTDPAGLNLEVTVPPPRPVERLTFAPERFTLAQDTDGRSKLTCPAGQTTRHRERLNDKHAYRYTFKPSQCAGCPLREECLGNPQTKEGRKVIKNDYEAEYRRVHEQAKTPEHEATRRLHPKIERKLGEVVRHHGNRRARYRGRAKVLCQSFMTALAVNVKRITKLLAQKIVAGTTALMVRAEPVTM